MTLFRAGSIALLGFALAVAALRPAFAGGVGFSDEEMNTGGDGPAFFGFVRLVDGPGIADAKVTAPIPEAARRAMTRYVKRGGKIWIRIFPDTPITKKPAEVRMGSGKGSPELWVARVKPGRVIFEIDGVTVQTAKEALSLAAAKLPIKTRFVARIAE